MNNIPEADSPAFPTTVENCLITGEQGISMRDYFAAKILQGRSAIPGPIDDEYEAKLCYRLADAMLRERAK